MGISGRMCMQSFNLLALKLWQELTNIWNNDFAKKSQETSNGLGNLGGRKDQPHMQSQHAKFQPSFKPIVVIHRHKITTKFSKTITFRSHGKPSSFPSFIINESKQSMDMEIQSNKHEQQQVCYFEGTEQKAVFLFFLLCSEALQKCSPFFLLQSDVKGNNWLLQANGTVPSRIQQLREEEARVELCFGSCRCCSASTIYHRSTRCCGSLLLLRET